MTEADLHAREKEAYLQVLECTPDEWDAALRAVCRGDVELRRRVESLLPHTGSADEAPAADDPSPAFTAAISSQYRIDGELGRGAMGTVFAAHDLKHDRSVAIKVLPEQIAAALGTKRFLQEVKVTARLAHPHVLPLIDSGVAAGTLYYVMPLIEGETLRQRLSRDRCLPPAEAFHTAAEVADALAYAHGRGVMHRDIKPENIMLADGHAIVMDFGIARVLESSTEARLTQVGGPIGTPAYMSPEQFRPDLALDERTDVYSLGCVLHEMLTGELPNRAGDAGGPGARLREAMNGAADGHADVVTSMTAWEARDRPSASAAHEALNGAASRLQAPLEERRHPRKHVTGIAVGFAIAGLVVAGSFVMRGEVAEATPGGGAPTIAVLPFETLGPAEDEYFADGITDAITARLANLDGLSVISRQSAVQYRDSDRSAPEIAELLGAAFLLQGTIQRERPGDPASRVRVIPQLIRASDDTHLWADKYDWEMTDVFQVQSDVASRVAEELEVTLRAEEQAALSAQPTSDLEAYEYYLRGKGGGLDSFNWSASELHAAEALFQRAVELDPGFALAHAELSRVHARLFRGADRSPERAAAALQSALRAVELAPELPQAHFALTWYHYFCQNDVENALAELETVLELQPSHAEAVTMVSPLYAASGRWDAAVETARRAVELDPRSASAPAYAATLTGMTRRYDESEGFADLAISLSPVSAELTARKAVVQHARSGDVEGPKALLAEVAPLVTPLAMATAISSEDLWGLVASGDYDALFDQALPDGVDDRNTVVYYLAKAKFYRVRGQPEVARSYFDSLRVVASGLHEALPSDALSLLMVAVGQAGLGERAEATTAAERYLALQPLEDDRVLAGAAAWHLAMIYMMLGDQDRALDFIEHNLTNPSWMTSHTVRLNPMWEPLRAEPRFQALIQDR